MSQAAFGEGTGGKHGVQGTVQSWAGDFSTGSECITKFRKERKFLATLPQSARPVQLYPMYPLDTPSLILPPPTSRGSANPLDPALQSAVQRASHEGSDSSAILRSLAVPSHTLKGMPAWEIFISKVVSEQKLSS